MSAIVYYLVLPLVYLISWMPFWLMYLVSDVLYLLVYKLIGYRTGVVYENLKNSFPEKSEQELKHIQGQFYKYFCDLVLETLKTLTISPRTLQKRVRFVDISAFKKFYEVKQSVIIVMGHLGNWELGGARFSQSPYHQLYVIYHPLSNPHFNRLIYHMRTRLGNKLYAMNETIRGMIKNRDDLTATAFIADQTPSPKGAYWTQFLNQDTPIFTGTAKISRKLNFPLIYVNITRPKRGFYDVHSEILIENPNLHSEDEISELHTRRLEKDIMRDPALWLWTHRRWKHKRT